MDIWESFPELQPNHMFPRSQIPCMSNSVIGEFVSAAPVKGGLSSHLRTPTCDHQTCILSHQYDIKNLLERKFFYSNFSLQSAGCRVSLLEDLVELGGILIQKLQLLPALEL